MSGKLSVNRLHYKDELDRIADAMAGPCLQIGSRQQVIDQQVEGRKTWRDRLAGKAFTGADLEAGENVDAIFDITWPLEQIRDALPGDPQFGAIICSHLLEHVRDPFAAARNIEALLAPGGTVFIQVPWVQGFHAFPDDFWRISLSGLGVLFPGLRGRDAFYSGSSSDVAYRVVRDGLTALDLTAREAEGPLFQVVLNQDANRRMLDQLKGPAYLSRGYMPIMVINWVARKPAE